MERSGKTTRFRAFFGFLDQKRCTPPFYLAQKCRPVQSQNQRLPKPSHFSVFVTPSPIPQQAFTPRIVRHFPNLILPHILPPHTFFITLPRHRPSHQGRVGGGHNTRTRHRDRVCKWALAGPCYLQIKFWDKQDFWILKFQKNSKISITSERANFYSPLKYKFNVTEISKVFGTPP